MLTMRAQETNLAQRRAERTQGLIQDTQRFAQDVFQKNRAYEANRADTEWAQARTAQQDALAEQHWQEQMGLRREEMAQREKLAGMRAAGGGRAMTQAEINQIRRDNYLNTVYGGGDPTLSPEVPADSPAPTTYTNLTPDQQQQIMMQGGDTTDEPGVLPALGSVGGTAPPPAAPPAGPSSRALSRESAAAATA